MLKDKNKNFLVAIKKKEKENQEIEQYSRDNQLKTKHKINFFKKKKQQQQQQLTLLVMFP